MLGFCTLMVFSGQVLASKKAPVLDSAFGFSFDGTVGEDRLGASMSEPPMISPTRAALLAAAGFNETTALPYWYHVSPDATPRLLRHQDIRYFAQLDDSRKLLNFVVELGPDCAGTGEQLSELLSRKYRIDASDLAVSSVFSRFSRWQFRRKQVYLACGEAEGWLVYMDPEALKKWQRSVKAEREDEQKLQKTGKVIQANRFAHGNRKQVDGGFGVYFAAQFPGFELLPSDEATEVTLENLRPPFDQGQFEVTVSPNGYPFRIAGVFNNLNMEWAAPLLEAKFGTPEKQTSRHIIHKVGEDFAILKRPSSKQLEIVFIDGHGQSGARSRAKDAEKAAWQDEVEGL